MFKDNFLGATVLVGILAGCSQNYGISTSDPAQAYQDLMSCRGTPSAGCALLPVDPSCATTSADTWIPYSQVGIACARDTQDPSAKFNREDGWVNFVHPPKLPASSFNALPSSCKNGFEVGNMGVSITGGQLPSRYTVRSLSTQGTSVARRVLIDLATYAAPDRIKIVVKNRDGGSASLLETCRMRTGCEGDQTGGLARPAEDTIRTYEVQLRSGTTAIDISVDDAADSFTPTYIRILGLCDFSLSMPTDWTAPYYRLSSGP